MGRILSARNAVLLLIALSAAAVFPYKRLLGAGDGFPIYFEDSTLVLKAQSVNRVVYLPLMDIVSHLKLPYTDTLALETFTIRGANSRLVLTKNSGLISVNEQIVFLSNPVLRENQQWLVPIEFLSQGLARVSGVAFRYRSGGSRIFAGSVKPTELVMNAQALGRITRLTIRADRAIKLDLRRDIPSHRAELIISPKPIDPLRERLEYRDRLVESIAFDDSDGVPRIVAAVDETVGDIRLNSADENRIHFVDFLRIGESPEAVPASPVPPAATTKLDPGQGARAIRVVVIDPGHGGIDLGTKTAGPAEKEVTLLLARALRAALQSRLGVTALLTRDSDVELTSEARSAVANNNQADLFLSLHTGYGDGDDPASSVYVIQDGFAAKLSPASQDRLFSPWYMGYRASRPSSVLVARMLQEELSKAVPEWKFPLRSGPVAVLASTTMPAVALEIGNLSVAETAQKMLDTAFQQRLVSAIVAAVERYVVSRRGGV